MTELTIDVSELKALARDLRRVDPILGKQFLKAMGKAGDVVADAARANASFSERIPNTIKVRRRGVAVRIQAGGAKAPHAAALENQGVVGTFRHPVFGHTETWVSQPAHPFLGPALEANQALVIREVIAVVDASFAQAGFHG